MRIDFGNFILLSLVFARMSGALLFHPFFGRKSVPVIAKIGLALLTAVLVTPVLQVPTPSFSSNIAFMLGILKEMLVGYVLGFLMNLYISWVLMAGETIDMEMGLGMGRIYDPQSNVSMPITGSFYNLMLTLIFFISNGHLTLIRILGSSCQLFPPGPVLMDLQAGSYLALMLGDMLVLALKLAMPVFAIELLSEAGTGVLMRIVPQINVFVVSLQLKLAIGILMVALALPAASKLMDATMTQMFEKVQESLMVMYPGA